jgi:hypothetical protein
MKSITGSCRGSSVLPLRRGFRSEDPQRLPEDEITLNVEVVEQGGMHTEKALGRSSRFEALHLALSSSYHLVLGINTREAAATRLAGLTLASARSWS